MDAVSEEGTTQQLRALERGLVEKALKDSRAVLSHLPQQQPPASEEEEGTPPAQAQASNKRGASAAALRAGGPSKVLGGLVDRVALLDAPGKCLFDFLGPRDLAAAQQVGG